MKSSLMESDLKLVDVVLGLFNSLYQGNGNAVKTDRLLFELAKLNIPVTGNNLRIVIGHIRRDDLLAPGFIVSDIAHGYWLSNDEREMREFFEKQMNRMTNQFHNVKRLKFRITKSQKNLQEVQTQMFE